MASLQEQMSSLKNVDEIPLLSPEEIIDLLKSKEQDNINEFDAGAEFYGGLDRDASEYSYQDAMVLAATLGVSDTVRGVKQIAGFDKEDMATDQRLLNKLMENPEWGNDIKWTYFGSLLLDPVGWLTPVSKAAQLAKAGYKFTKWQKARKLAKHGAVWGGISGYTGYVDTDSSNRGFNTLAGVAGGAILAPALGVSADAITKFLSKKSPKELLDDPQGAVKELTGNDTPRLTNDVKRFYYGLFQPSKQKYDELTKQYLYKPLILDNPIASVGAGASAFGAMTIFGDDVDKYIDRLEDERDMDTGPWRAALQTLLIGGAAVAGFKTTKLKFKGKSVEDFIGRRVIDNYKLSDDFIKLKDEAFFDFNDLSYQFTEIAEKAKGLSKEEKSVLYYFLGGDVGDAGLSKEAVEIGAEARALLQEVGQRMVDAGLLKPSTFREGMHTYIHRTYGKKVREDKFLKEIRADINEDDKLGFIGTELMARGHPERRRVTDKVGISDLEAKGYVKFRDPINGIQTLRKELTLAERKALDEIDDAAYAIKSSGDLMLNDLAFHKFSKDVYQKFGFMDEDELATLLKKSKTAKTEDERILAASQYKAYKDSGKKTYDKLSPEEQDGMVQMPSDKLLKTGINKYGELSGKWVPKEMADDIKVQKAFSDGESLLGRLYAWKPFQKYRRANSMWKRSKTSWNPTVHTNNTVSNFFLLDAHDVSFDTFLEHGFRVFTKKGQNKLDTMDLGFGPANVYNDLVRLGVFDAGLAKAELMIGKADWKEEYAKEFLGKRLKRGATKDIDPVRDMEDQLEFATNVVARSYRKYTDWIDKTKIGTGVIGKKIAGKEALKNPVKWLDKGATDLYQREDQMFRVALYVDRLQKRIPELNQFTKGSSEYATALEQIKRSAAKEAKTGFIDYNIQAPFIQVLRDSSVPFISYAYRIIPLLAKTATLKPHKFAKWAAVGYALDYAGRERSQEQAKYDRSIMQERHLSRMFGLPFMPYTSFKVPDIPRGAEQFAQKRFDVSLGWGLDKDPRTGDKLPQRTLLFDGLRYIPGGDSLGQTTPEQGGTIAGLPAPFQPSFGLAGEVIISLAGIDPFTGKHLEDKSAINNSIFMLQRLVPNNPLLGMSGYQKLFGSEERTRVFDSWSHQKIMNTLERRPDSSDYAPDLPILMALAQTVGIKLWPFDEVKSLKLFNLKTKIEIDELRKRIRSRQKVLKKYVGTESYERELEKAKEEVDEWRKKMEDIMRIALGKKERKYKFKYGRIREQEFGEVPLDIVKSISEKFTDE
mgnify:FL=1